MEPLTATPEYVHEDHCREFRMLLQLTLQVGIRVVRLVLMLVWMFIRDHTTFAFNQFENSLNQKVHLLDIFLSQDI